MTWYHILFILIGIERTLLLVYFFQIKEFRFDRFQSFVKQEGLLKILYFSKPVMPAKKPRNLLIAIISIFLLTGFIYLVQPHTFAALLVILLAPFISLFTVSFGVFLTNIPVTVYREWIITRAKNKVFQSKATFIGITGSYGKTSVKEFLYHILATKYKVGKTDKNMNTDVGIGLSILKNLKADTEFFITEIGAYKLGEIAKACEIVPIQYAILTSLGNQHLDLFGSKENLIKAKSELFEALSKDGKAYINADSPESDKIASRVEGKVIYFSTEKKSDIFAQNIKVNNNKLQAQITLNDVLFEIKTNLLGTHNIANLLPCIALAHDLGMKKEEIITAIASLKQVPGKFSIEKGRDDSTILNDSNNSNVDGFIAGIQIMNNFSQSTKIIVSKGIIELGVEKRASYERIMKELEKTNIKLFTTDSDFKEYDNREQVKTFNDVLEIQQDVSSKLNKDTLVLIEGRFPESFVKQLMAPTS